MLTPDELILSLSRRGKGSYQARLTLRDQKESEADIKTFNGVIKFDPEALREYLGGDSYGMELTQAVFTGDLREHWIKFRGGGRLVCLRLELDENDWDLHEVRWETLWDPETLARQLLTDQKVWFSRHLVSSDMGPIRPSTKRGARVLLAVASPDNPEEWGVDHIDAGKVIAEVKKALREWVRNVDALPDSKHGPPTLENINRRLRDQSGGYDIVYLIAHGKLVDNHPALMLVDDHSRAAWVDGSRFAAQLGKLRYPPRLVVLSSCQSAGGGSAGPGDPGDGLVAALGPLLGRFGIPAVLAMRGRVFQQTANKFVGAFFEHLREDGQVDRAAAEARFAVAREPDYWSPVLYSRLTTGRLWRSEEDSDQFNSWDALISNLEIGKCLPVLGPGMLEPLIGPTQGIAERLTGGKKPIAPAADLPQNAQFIKATIGLRDLRLRYLNELTAEVKEQFDSLTPVPDLGRKVPAQAPEDTFATQAMHLRRLLAAAAERLHAESPPEPHRALASLNCPVYLSTNPDDVLTRALVDEGKDPDVRVCNWLHPDAGPPGVVADARGPGSATPPADAEDDLPEASRAPLVWHLFGHLCDSSSVVLSEDDYFKFLVETQKPKPELAGITSAVGAQLRTSVVLFLGFRLDDWSFRAFLRFFMEFEAAKTRQHEQVLDVAVVLDPDDGRNADPTQVRRYIKELFRRYPSQPEIKIYWGSAREFLQELAARYRRQATAEPAGSRGPALRS
jgi:hypothetical protein